MSILTLTGYHTMSEPGQGIASHRLYPATSSHEFAVPQHPGEEQDMELVMFLFVLLFNQCQRCDVVLACWLMLHKNIQRSYSSRSGIMKLWCLTLFVFELWNWGDAGAWWLRGGRVNVRFGGARRGNCAQGDLHSNSMQIVPLLRTLESRDGEEGAGVGARGRGGQRHAHLCSQGTEAQQWGQWWCNHPSHVTWYHQARAVQD